MARVIITAGVMVGAGAIGAVTPFTGRRSTLSRSRTAMATTRPTPTTITNPHSYYHRYHAGMCAAVVTDPSPHRTRHPSPIDGLKAPHRNAARGIAIAGGPLLPALGRVFDAALGFGREAQRHH